MERQRPSRSSLKRPRKRKDQKAGKCLTLKGLILSMLYKEQLNGEN